MFYKKASQAKQYRVGASFLYISLSLSLSVLCHNSVLPKMNTSVFETKNYICVPRY